MCPANTRPWCLEHAVPAAPRAAAGSSRRHSGAAMSSGTPDSSSDASSGGWGVGSEEWEVVEEGKRRQGQALLAGNSSGGLAAGNGYNKDMEAFRNSEPTLLCHLQCSCCSIHRQKYSTAGLGKAVPIPTGSAPCLSPACVRYMWFPAAVGWFMRGHTCHTISCPAMIAYPTMVSLCC